MDYESKIKELEKKVEELSFIHGISDKFGTYQSLCKDAEIIMFFLANTGHKRRYIELIDNFTSKGWSRSTTEVHLHKLTKYGILKRTRLPGEYEIEYNMSRDMDMLVHYLIGDSLYRLAKKSWEKEDYQY
jgi:hypothetical protein